MKRLHQFLMAGTVLSGVAAGSLAAAGTANVTSAENRPAYTTGRRILIAQTAEPEKKGGGESEKKPDITPPKRPDVPPKPPAVVAPPPPPAAAKPPERAAPPAASHPAPPAAEAPVRPTQVVPPAAQNPPPVGSRPVTPPGPQVPPHPATPPAAQNGPHGVLPATPGEPPAVPGPPVTPPPAAQTTPAAPPAAQSRPPAGPVAPPAAQAPSPRPAVPSAAQSPPQVVPPAAQANPPALPGRPGALLPAAQRAPQPVPAATSGAVAPSTAAGVAPNMQNAPLSRSGVPTPSAEQAKPIAPAAAGAGISPQSAQGQPLRRMDQLRAERHEFTQDGQTIIREPDRTIIREGGQTVIRHSEVDRFRYGAQDVRIEQRGSDNVTIVVRPGGDRVVTVVDENGFLLRRSRILPDGREIIIIDNRPRGAGVGPGGGYGGFFVNLPPPVIRIPRERYIVEDERATPALLYETLLAPPLERIERRYSLDEIRYTAPLRDRMPRIDLNAVTFDTGSWELTPDQVQKLAAIAEGLNRAIQHNPSEVFLIEGYTDAVGSEVDNLSLSDRRAESVAIALTQQFDVPAENLSTQGYGEQYLKIPTNEPERANRRVTVRRITPLLTGQSQ